MVDDKRRRAFVGLVCCVALCCVVVTLMSDEADETTHASFRAWSKDPRRQRSILSKDVEKVGIIFTRTPDGRMRLLRYFKKVELLIAREMAARKADVAAVRAQMARNMAYNIAARKKMKAMMLKRMAANAKVAKKALAAAMRKAAAKFAQASELGNKRNRANIARSKQTREIMRKNKREGQRKLQSAVAGMQRSLAAVSQSVNARIAQTNKHVAANAAAIKENARAARQNLKNMMNRFNKKMGNANEQAKKGRSRLAAMGAAMNKKTRALIANKINAVAASTASQFDKVRTQMAKDRHRADMLLKQATSRMQAALNANRALMDKRFARTVADIAAAKKEAASRVTAATAEFKIGLLNLGATVRHQATKLNSRVTQLAGVVANNKLEQDKVNRNVGAEMKRMIKLGNDRYNQHLKSDQELRKLMAKNKAQTQATMNTMATSFNAQLGKIRGRMKKDRAMATHMLATRTGALYTTLMKNAKRQKAAAKKQNQLTARAKLNMMRRLRESKAVFSKRLAKLQTTVIRSERKNSKRLHKLTGVVTRNAVRSANGRKLLQYQMKAGKLELQNALRQAVHKGEQNAIKLQNRMKDMNKKSMAALNQKVAVKISKLAKSVHKSVNQVRMENKRERAALKKELVFAVQTAAKEAKKNLVSSVKTAQGRFLQIQQVMSSNRAKGAAAQARLVRRLKQDSKQAKRAIRDAVAEQTRALLALKSETTKSIKATNRNVDARAKQMAQMAKAAAAKMKVSMNALKNKLAAAQTANKKELAMASSASARRQGRALAAIKKALNKAKRNEALKFQKLYLSMSRKRKNWNHLLSAATEGLNNQLAKQSALKDARFRKSVKYLNVAKQKVAKAVLSARKSFTTGIVACTAIVKAQETRMAGEIAVVSDMTISNQQVESRIRRRVFAEISRVVRVSNRRVSTSSRAQGRLRKLLNINKKVAAEQVSALATYTIKRLWKARKRAARTRQPFAIALSNASKRLFVKVARAQMAQQALQLKASSTNKAALASAQAEVKLVRAQFTSMLKSLVNVQLAGNRSFNKAISRLTYVPQQMRRASVTDLRMLRTQRKAMLFDMTKVVTRAIQLGVARGKAQMQSSNVSKRAARLKAIQGQLSARVERAADKAFKQVPSVRRAMADNYLSVKAYTAAAKWVLADYVRTAKGRGLSSIGDFLVTVSRVSSLRAKRELGLGNGEKTVPLPFDGGKVLKVSTALTKVNGLANEFMRILVQVQTRWPFGLGKYLLKRLQISMQKKGILQVDRVVGKSGNHVFVNPRTVGLSNKVSDFLKLARKMREYGNKLSQLTKKLAKNANKAAPTVKTAKQLQVMPPEYQGT